MLWRDIGYLLRDEEKLDDLRKPYKVTTEKEVFCNKKSVRQSEFYQAQAQGYKPELMFVVRSSEYNGEAYFKHKGIITIISKVIEIALVPLQASFTALSGVLGGVVTMAFDNLKNTFETWKTIAMNLIDFVKNVFTGNWSGAWENVKNIFTAAFDGIKNGFKIPINFIIDGLNAFIKGLNKLQIPDWVPGVGGKGINIGQIPRLRIGMDYVPYDDFPAILHKGERILTAAENKEHERNSRGKDGTLAAPISMAIALNIENFINNTDKDIKSLMDEIMVLIEEYLKRKGVVWA